MSQHHRTHPLSCAQLYNLPACQEPFLCRLSAHHSIRMPAILTLNCLGTIYTLIIEVWYCPGAHKRCGGVLAGEDGAR